MSFQCFARLFFSIFISLAQHFHRISALCVYIINQMNSFNVFNCCCIELCTARCIWMEMKKAANCWKNKISFSRPLQRLYLMDIFFVFFSDLSRPYLCIQYHWKSWCFHFFTCLLLRPCICICLSWYEML